MLRVLSSPGKLAQQTSVKNWPKRNFSSATSVAARKKKVANIR